jgi:hypothetical protein
VDPVPDPLLLRKSGSTGNRSRDLWICSQELWPLDHRGGLGLILDSLIERVTTFYNSPLHTHTHTHTRTIMSTVTSTLAVARQRIPTANVALTLGSRIITEPQRPTSHSNSSKRLNLRSSLTHSLTHQPTLSESEFNMSNHPIQTPSYKSRTPPVRDNIKVNLRERE